MWAALAVINTAIAAVWVLNKYDVKVSEKKKEEKHSEE